MVGLDKSNISASFSCCHICSLFKNISVNMCWFEPSFFSFLLTFWCEINLFRASSLSPWQVINSTVHISKPVLSSTMILILSGVFQPLLVSFTMPIAKYPAWCSILYASHKTTKKAHRKHPWGKMEASEMRMGWKKGVVLNTIVGYNTQIPQARIVMLDSGEGGDPFQHVLYVYL